MGYLFKRHYRFWLFPLFFGSLLMCLSEGVAFAMTAEDDTPLTALLAQQKIQLETQKNANSLLSEPATEEGLAALVQQNKENLTWIRIEISSLENFLKTERFQASHLRERVNELESVVKDRTENTEATTQLNDLNAQLKKTDETLTLITENLNLTRRYQSTLLDTKNQLIAWQEKKRSEARVAALDASVVALKMERDALYKKNIDLRATEPMTRTAKVASALNNQQIVLVNNQIALLALKVQLSQAENNLVKNQNLKTLYAIIAVYNDAQNQLYYIENALELLLQQLASEKPYLSNPALLNTAQLLQKKIEETKKNIVLIRQELNSNLDFKQQALKKELSVRQTLAAYRLDSLEALWSNFSQLPMQLRMVAIDLYKPIAASFLQRALWSQVMLVVVMLLLMTVGIWAAVSLNYYFARIHAWGAHHLSKKHRRDSFSRYLYEGGLFLLARNIPQVMLVGIIFYLLTNAGIASNADGVAILSLLWVWLFFRNLILMTRFIVVERLPDISGNSLQLFRRLQWLLLFGGWAVALLVVSPQWSTSIVLQMIAVRFFMLFIIALALVLWRSKEIISTLVRPLLDNKKSYVRHAFFWFMLLLPITLLTTGMMGLLGYVNLAWSMSKYQANVVLIVVGWIVLRGLSTDLLKAFSRWMMRNLHNGWLWIEVFLKPLDKSIHAILLIGSLLLLVQRLGTYSNAHIIGFLKQVVTYNLVDISGAHITFMSILQFLMLVVLLTWMSKWTREFCYRWLYRDVKDIGIRNSVSVFTQYGVILLGGYITLRVLGLDFGGMSMVLGGFAVGMGFGLRDFASNIVGGVMLLIERPVREGDLITIGDYEGRVAHIGIRSMRVSSWDNTEVLIPNAETFNKPFTNWTHQDNVVRTVVPIKVNRVDDPVMVQRLIFDVLATELEILKEPEPQVYLKQIDDALLEFEVRYFINIFEHTRFEIRSKFLFALMARFKTMGIQPPIPPLSVEIKS